jgi:hypothetical protein
MSRKDTFAADSAREAPAVKIAMNNSRDTIGINHRKMKLAKIRNVVERTRSSMWEGNLLDQAGLRLAASRCSPKRRSPRTGTEVDRTGN